MDNFEIIEASKKLLKAFVIAKSGKYRKAGKLFAEAVEDEAIDPVMDGIAKSVQELEAEEEEKILEEDMEEEEDDSKDLDIDISGKNDDKDEDDDMDDEDEEEIEEVEVPASVAKVLNLEY